MSEAGGDDANVAGRGAPPASPRGTMPQYQQQMYYGSYGYPNMGNFSAWDMQYMQQYQQYQMAMQQQQQQQYYMMLQQQQQQQQKEQASSSSSSIGMLQARDMDQLRHFILQVQSEDIRRVLKQAQFKPRQNAFTSLIQMAGKYKQTDKAIAIFEAMHSTHAVKPNTYTYTALISSLARTGEWALAEQYFDEMKKKYAEEKDESVAPNRVTFSSMISAYEKANKFDKALQIFQEQIESGIEPDYISFSSVLNACLKGGDMKAVRDVLESMHSQSIVGPQQLYDCVIAAYKSDWKGALEVFLGMQCVGVEVSSDTLNLIMKSLCMGEQKEHALWLVEEAKLADIELKPQSYESILALCAEQGDYKSADRVYACMRETKSELNGKLAGMILSAHMQGGSAVEKVRDLNEHFESLGISPVLPVKQEVVEHDASPVLPGSGEGSSVHALKHLAHVMGQKMCQASIANDSLDSAQSEFDM